MTGPEVAFLIVGVVGSVAAFRLVTSRNVVRAALYLVLTLAMVGATYLLVGAEFIGWTQVLIYVGAIVVLVLFALMLTRAPIGRDTLDNQQRLLALVVSVGILAGLVFLIQGAFGGKKIVVHPRHLALGLAWRAARLVRLRGLPAAFRLVVLGVAGLRALGVL